MPYQPKDVSKADKIYYDFVCKEGLFGKAFFGHKKTRKESSRLNYLWRRAMKLAGEE